MADPLDLKIDVGPSNEYLELLEELLDLKDPFEIIAQCEDQDADEGLPPGTTLQLYYISIKTSR